MESRTANAWGVTEVCEWLASLELGQYSEKFEEMKIDGMLLFEMTDTDLKEDLGVPVRLHRFKILESIKILKEAPEPENSQQQAASQSPSSQASTWDVLSLKAVEGQLANNTFIIGTSGASVGRNSSTNHIVISESFVSRRHCDIRYDSLASQFLLVDLGSTTGTFVMVREEIALTKNMMFQMGLSEFKVKTMKFNPYGKAIELELHCYEGPARDDTILVDEQGLTVGRDPGNSLSVRDDSQMSGFHSEIKYKEGAFYLKDLNSTNRTWIRLSAEGVKSDPHQLLVDEVIKIGSTVLQVSLPDNQSPLNKLPIQEDQACKICYSRVPDTALYPCGHMLCNICATKCRTCPNCRSKIDDYVKLYR